MICGNVFLFHGNGGSPQGSVSQLEELLRQYYPGGNVTFHRPRLLHSDPAVPAEESLASLTALNVPKDSAIIGVSLGGLVAARLQEQGREDLHVICISSPTWADGVCIERRMPNRVAFYSSRDEVITRRTSEWPKLAQAFDFPWLTHDTDAHKLPLARLAFAYLDGDSFPHAIQEVESSLKRS